MHEFEDTIQEERMSQRAEQLLQEDVERTLLDTERAAHVDQYSQVADKLQHGRSHGLESKASDPEPTSRHGEQCDMMARLRACPRRPRRHVLERRLDAAAELANVCLRKRVTLPHELDGVDGMESRIDASDRLPPL